MDKTKKAVLEDFKLYGFLTLDNFYKYSHIQSGSYWKPDLIFHYLKKFIENFQSYREVLHLIRTRYRDGWGDV